VPVLRRDIPSGVILRIVGINYLCLYNCIQKGKIAQTASKKSSLHNVLNLSSLEVCRSIGYLGEI
jgi:hypothetical protein